MQAIKAIVKQGLKAEIFGLARASQIDIDSAIKCDLKCIHTFIATSDIHMQYKLKMTRQQVTEKAISAVEYAKKHGLQVEFSAEDATRSDRQFLLKVFKEVAEAGADRLDIHCRPCKRSQASYKAPNKRPLPRRFWICSG
jgi:2-isopropylmalate synthase